MVLVRYTGRIQISEAQFNMLFVRPEYIGIDDWEALHKKHQRSSVEVAYDLKIFGEQSTSRVFLDIAYSSLETYGQGVGFRDLLPYRCRSASPADNNLPLLRYNVEALSLRKWRLASHRRCCKRVNWEDVHLPHIPNAEGGRDV